MFPVAVRLQPILSTQKLPREAVNSKQNSLLMQQNGMCYCIQQRLSWKCTPVQFHQSDHFTQKRGELGGSVVACRTPEREVGGSKPTAAVLCPWARHFTPRKYWLITQEAVAPSRHDWKIVDWDVKPQHKQNKTSHKEAADTRSRKDSDQNNWMFRLIRVRWTHMSFCE